MDEQIFIQTLARYMNSVKTAGEARHAIGQVLTLISKGYRALPSVHLDKSGIDPDAARLRLDALRMSLETYYRVLPQTASFVLARDTFPPIRKKIDQAAMEAIGIEAAAKAESSGPSFLAELGKGFRDLPADIGKASGEIVNVAGRTVGTGLGGILSGLGVWGFLLLAVVGIVIFVKVAD